jgi:hypothetical protein
MQEIYKKETEDSRMQCKCDCRAAKRADRYGVSGGRNTLEKVKEWDGGMGLYNLGLT